jgi:hypothetical protein
MPTNSKKSTGADLSALLEGLLEAGGKFILVEETLRQLEEEFGSDEKLS